MSESMVSADEMCEVCRAKSRIETAAVTRDERERPVCFSHAPNAYRDEQRIVRSLTEFVTWHEEQAARLDAVVAEAKKPNAKLKNKALAQAHRRAAEAIRKALRPARAG